MLYLIESKGTVTVRQYFMSIRKKKKTQAILRCDHISGVGDVVMGAGKGNRLQIDYLLRVSSILLMLLKMPSLPHFHGCMLSYTLPNYLQRSSLIYSVFTEHLLCPMCWKQTNWYIRSFRDLGRQTLGKKPHINISLEIMVRV